MKYSALQDGWSSKSACYTITTMKFCGNCKDNLPISGVCECLYTHTLVRKDLCLKI